MGSWISEDPKGGRLFNPRSYNAISKGINFTKEQTEYQLFPEEYFTAADCAIYFNDVWMDELTGLSFTLSENVKPHFSYGSKTWDYVSRGNRLVSGEFRIAFKEAGYLFTILEHIGTIKKKSPALGYLMNDRSIPVWHGQVQQNIEEILSFWYEQGQKLPDKEEKYSVPHSKEEKWLYKWPRIQKGKTGKAYSMVMWENKYTNTKEHRHGTNDAIKQLQSRLIELGYSWKPINFGWKKHYGGDTWYSKTPSSGGKRKSVNVPGAVFSSNYIKGKIGKSWGDWYVCMRFTKDRALSIGGNDAYSSYEAALQKRMDSYPGKLDGFYMGGRYGQYDGRYGGRISKGVQFFLQLAEHDDGSNGYWVTDWCKKELEKGLAVTGQYDVPTKIAVMAFQSNNGLRQTGYVDYATMEKMAPMKTTEWKEEKSRMVPRPLYNDNSKTAEPRMAQYEKEIWGRPFVGDAERVRNSESFFYRGDYQKDIDGKEFHTTEWLYQNGIDLYINYGPLAENIVATQGNAPDREYKNGNWYPKTESKIPASMSFNTTVKAVRNVQIYEVSQVIDPNSGQPIEEVYKFIARDLD